MAPAASSESSARCSRHESTVSEHQHPVWTSPLHRPWFFLARLVEQLVLYKGAILATLWLPGHDESLSRQGASSCHIAVAATQAQGASPLTRLKNRLNNKFNRSKPVIATRFEYILVTFSFMGEGLEHVAICFEDLSNASLHAEIAARSMQNPAWSGNSCCPTAQGSTYWSWSSVTSGGKLPTKSLVPPGIGPTATNEM